MFGEENVEFSSKKIKQMNEIKIKKLCVTQRGDKYYYPPTIPRERGNLSKRITIILCFILVLAHVSKTNRSLPMFLMCYIRGYLGNFLLHLMYRFTLIFEEFKHKISRYEGSYLTIIKDTFSFSNTIIFITMISLFGLCIIWLNEKFHVADLLHLDLSDVFCVIPTTFLLGKMLKLNASPLNNSLQISEINGLDYGAGMAHSFFNGYLKLIMQKGTSDSEANDLKELMEIYEDQHGVRFLAYKLFILIPISLRCFDSLKNGFSKSVEESHTLPEKRITVAGVQNRVYKNSVYKINYGENKKIYVSAEYASPLKTFNDVAKSSDAQSVYYKKHKNEISLQFYLTLKRILKAEHFDEFCELIYFEDSYKDKNNETVYYDVGEILLARLKDLTRNQRQKSE